MKPDDIISYSELVAEEKANLQKGMNFGIGNKYSVFLMSVRPGAPYRDKIDPVSLPMKQTLDAEQPPEAPEECTWCEYHPKVSGTTMITP